MKQPQLSLLCHIPPSLEDNATVVEHFVSNRNERNCRGGWKAYKNLLKSKPENAIVYPGVSTSSFNRSVPTTLDPLFPQLMNKTLNLLQVRKGKERFTDRLGPPD